MITHFLAAALAVVLFGLGLVGWTNRADHARYAPVVHTLGGLSTPQPSDGSGGLPGSP